MNSERLRGVLVAHSQLMEFPCAEEESPIQDFFQRNRDAFGSNSGPFSLQGPPTDEAPARGFFHTRNRVLSKENRLQGSFNCGAIGNRLKQEAS